MASMTYKYTSFTSNTSFRLIRVNRQKASRTRLPNSIEVDLFEANLENPPNFEAISYAWGQEKLDAVVICNGQALYVTPTVLSVLCALHQHLDSVGVFWIDSICIDQSSIPERNMQVPKMRSIYREAAKVWVWLGEGSPEVDIAFDFLLEVNTIQEHNITSGTALSQALKEPRERYNEKISQARGYNDAVDTNFIIDLLNLSWFRRTWTVQELVLAREAIFLYGAKGMLWKSLVQTLWTLQNIENSELWNHSRATISNPAAFYDDTLCYRRLGGFIDSSYSILPISTPLRLVRSKMSTDPRDKVFGVYGIFDYMQIPCLPQVDYTKSVSQVYTEITRTAIEHEKSLIVLHGVCLASVIPDLPSWVPDWSNSAYIAPIFNMKLAATRHSESIYSFSGTLLTVFADLIDIVSEAASSTSNSGPSFRRGYKARVDLGQIDVRRSSVMELVRTLQSWSRCGRSIQRYPTGEPAQEAFFRTIACNSVKNSSDQNFYPTVADFEDYISILMANEPANDIDIETLHTKVRSLPEYTAIRDDYIGLFGCSATVEDWPDELKIRLFLKVYSYGVAAVQHTVSLNTYHRTFFTTRDGYMGIGPRWTEPTDFIALIAGLNMPFVVRKDGKNHRLIGPAYIHGVMEGERWDKSRLQALTFA